MFITEYSSFRLKFSRLEPQSTLWVRRKIPNAYNNTFLKREVSCNVLSPRKPVISKNFQRYARFLGTT